MALARLAQEPAAAPLRLAGTRRGWRRPRPARFRHGVCHACLSPLVDFSPHTRIGRVIPDAQHCVETLATQQWKAVVRFASGLRDGARRISFGAWSSRLLSESVPFFSPCPKCHQARLQQGYTRADLLEYLESGHPIDAYCIRCDVLWAVSAQERIGLAEQVSPGLR